MMKLYFQLEIIVIQVLSIIESFLSVKNPELLKKFEEIFSNDFAWIKNIYDDNLVLSPFYSRDKMEYLIKNAKSSIKIYSHNFWEIC